VDKRPPKPWHRWLGILLTDLFVGRPWSVAMEEELSLKSQRLDILIIERRGAAGVTPDPEAVNDLPDGLDNLAAHNLLSYKSAAEPFNAWALEELISHYVTYRKLASLRAAHRGARTADEPLAEPAGAYPLLPTRDFRRYAIATRQPRQLLRQLPTGTCRATACPGVYDLAVGALPVRLIVLDSLAKQPRNAPWGLFAHASDQTQYGLTHYRPRSSIGIFLRDQLAKDFALETDMAYTVEDFKREAMRDLLNDVLSDPKHLKIFLDRLVAEDRLRELAPEERLRGLAPEERLRGLAPEERLRGLAPEDRLRGLAPEERLRGLAPEERLRELAPEERLRGLAPEERLQGLDPAIIEAWLKQHPRHDH